MLQKDSLENFIKYIFALKKLSQKTKRAKILVFTIISITFQLSIYYITIRLRHAYL